VSSKTGTLIYSYPEIEEEEKVPIYTALIGALIAIANEVFMGAKRIKMEIENYELLVQTEDSLMLAILKRKEIPDDNIYEIMPRISEVIREYIKEPETVIMSLEDKKRIDEQISKLISSSSIPQIISERVARVFRVSLNTVLIPTEDVSSTVTSEKIDNIGRKCGLDIRRVLELLDGIQTLKDIALRMNISENKILECAEILIAEKIVNRANDNYILLLYYHKFVNQVISSLVKLLGKANWRRIAKKLKRKLNEKMITDILIDYENGRILYKHIEDPQQRLKIAKQGISKEEVMRLMLITSEFLSEIKEFASEFLGRRILDGILKRISEELKEHYDVIM